MELCIFLAYLMRIFEMRPIYSEWDVKCGAKEDKMVHGERVY